MGKDFTTLGFAIANVWISIRETVGDIAYEEDSEKRENLFGKYLLLDRRLRLMLHAESNSWEKFSFKRLHEEQEVLCAADYWEFEELWDFPMPDRFNQHEEKRRRMIEIAKQNKAAV